MDEPKILSVIKFFIFKLDWTAKSKDALFAKNTFVSSIY